MQKKILLAGNGITADIIYAYLCNDVRYEIAGATVDDEYTSDNLFHGLPCVGLSKVDEHFSPSEVIVIMAMGYNDLNRSRMSMYGRLKEKGFSVETYIHPDAKIYTDNLIGEGTIILPGAVVEPYATVGENTMIWCNTTVAHHATVGSHCWLASGCVISGSANICDNVFLGVNSTVVNEVKVESLNIVGAGALMTKCTKPNTVHLARTGEQFRYSAEDYVKFFGV